MHHLAICIGWQQGCKHTTQNLSICTLNFYRNNYYYHNYHVTTAMLFFHNMAIADRFNCVFFLSFQHTSRIFYDNEEKVILEDSGVWMTPLDYLGIQPFSDIPMFKKASPAPQEGVYGGFPYYLPLRHIVRYVVGIILPLYAVKPHQLKLVIMQVLYPGRNRIWKCWYFRREENQRTHRKMIWIQSMGTAQHP